MEGELDIRIRVAAFEHVRALNATHDYLSSQQLAEDFWFEGNRLPLVNPQRGISNTACTGTRSPVLPYK
jgi:putative restriction endonuclease